MPKYRIKSDILGVDFGIRTDEKLTERDYFDILKTKVQPQDLLHAYKSAPYDEKRQNLATKALDNGFFDQDVGFTESVAEVGGMVGQGIGDMLTTNIYATSRLQRARMQYGDADTEQVYQPLIEEGIKKAGQQLKGLAYAAKRTDRSIEDDLSQAMQFAGIPRDDENLQRRVIAEAQRQDQSQVAATQAQMGVEAAGMMAMIGAKGNELIERVKADSSKESKLAQIEYLADKFDIAEKIEKGAELGLAEAGLLGTLTDVYLGKNLSPFDVNQEALEDVQSGLVEPDREVAMVGSVVADPSFVATMGAAGGVNAMRNVLARGMVIRTGEKAAQESSLRLFLSRAENIAKPSTQQKALIKSAEQKLAKVAGSGEKLDKLVAKSQGVAQAKVGSLIQSGEASTQSGARLVNSLSKALENAPSPKAPIFNRMTGKILERAGMTTETLGRTIEFIQRLPEETLTTLFMKTGGMSQEAALTAARGTARTLQTGAAAGVLTGGFNEFSPELENLGLALLLAPGGSSLVTRFGHDAAILGKQLQFAQASSPLFQRIAQLDPADASLTSVIIDRSSALTIPETISGLAEGIFSKSRQFGPSPALKVPSTALAKTGLGNTLTGAVNTAKTVVGASTIPGAIGYALDGEAGAGGAIGASWPFLAAGLGMGTLAKFGSKSDLYMKMAGDEAYFKDTYLDSTDRASYESQPRIVRQAIATSNIQNPDVIFRFKEGKPPPGESSNFSVENGESVITIYGKSHPQEVLSAIFGHEVAHHIDTFGFMPQIIDELIGSVEKGKPGVYTEFKNGKPVINKDAEGREVYATNKDFQKHRQQYLDRLEAGGIKKGTDGYDQYANNDAQIAREIFAAHGADWYFGGEFVKKNWQGAGAKMMGAMLDPLFGSTGLRKFFHRIGLATSEETGLVADPTGLFPGLKEVPALTRMIEKYNSDVRGYGPQARREGRGRGNLVDPAFKDEVATVNLTAKDLENPAIVNRLKAGGVVKIKDDGTIETDVEGRPVFLPTREVNKNNKKLSNDILEIIRKKEDAGETFGEGHVSLEKTVDGRDRATGVFIDPSIIDQLQGKYNPHQLAALKQINQTLRNGTGDVWDLFYYSALKYNKAGRKVYGQIKGGDRSSLPFGIEITKDGNINIQTISMDAFIKNLEWFAKSKGYSQKMAQAFGGMNPFENTQAALKLLPKYLQNHLNKIENGTPESGITVAQRDLINGAIGRMNADQVKANPVLEGLGDRRSQRQQSYRSRRLDRIGNAVRGEPGYPAVKSAIEQNKLPMRIPNDNLIPFPKSKSDPAPLPGVRRTLYQQDTLDSLADKGLISYEAGKNDTVIAKVSTDGYPMPDYLTIYPDGSVEQAKPKLFMPASEAGAGERNILFMPTQGDTTPASVQSWDGPNPTFGTNFTRGMVKDNKEAAALLRKSYEDQFGEPLRAQDFTEEQVNWLGDMFAKEGEAALGRTGNAVDWYTSAVERALAVAEEIFPDIGQKYEAKDRFLGALSITSQNMRVMDNAKGAVKQYQHKERTGKFDYSIKHGAKADAITKNLKLYDQAEAKMGAKDLHEFLDTDFTVKELSEWGRGFFGDKKFSIAGYSTDMVKGSAIFGPKIGQGFFQNLRGNYNPVTVDLWLRRTFGRLTGLALDTQLKPGDIGRLIYSVRKNVGKRKFSGLELPEFLKGVSITGKVQGNGVANFKISDQSYNRLFGDNTIGRDNYEAVYEFAGKLNKEWERRFATAGNDVTKAKKAIKAAKKEKKSTANLEKKLAKLEIEKEAIGKEKPQWAKAGSTVSDKLKPIDIPSNAERAVITKAFNVALKTLRDKGIDLTPADLQATLWYPEKDIWAFLKGENSDALNMSYDTAMEVIRDQR